MKKIILLIFVLVGIISSCTKGYEDLNKDPLKTNKVPTTSILTGVLQSMININSGLGYNKTFMLYSQQWSQRETTTRSLYVMDDTSSDWSNFYLNGLPELQEIIRLNSGEDKSDYDKYGKNENQIAVSKILKVWYFSNITDTWGNIPYTEALDNNISFPKYDKQEVIYPLLIQELKDAANMIDENASGFVSGDLMYGGNMNKWKKFANSLRARIAMRMSEVNPSLAQNEVADALSSDVFTSNADNASVNFQNEEANANPLYLEFLTQQWTFVSKPLIDLMNSYGNGTASVPSDPRIPHYADPNQNGEYIGFPYGLTTSESLNYNIEDFSLPAVEVRAMDFASQIMTFSELLFIKAEAEQRGWYGNSADAANTYYQAITASMEQWGISSTDINTYLALADVQYNTTNWRKLIGEQKYIALYTQGANAWNEWKRLDYPVLQFPVAATAVSEIPRRLKYPLSELSLNADNLAEAISDLGSDTMTTHYWWDQ